MPNISDGVRQVDYSLFHCDIGKLLRVWSAPDNPLRSLLDSDSDVYYEEFNTVNEAASFRNARTIKSPSNTQPINEKTYKTIIRQAEKKRVQRSKTIRVYYSGVKKAKGWIMFHTPSQSIPNKQYYQYIRLRHTNQLKRALSKNPNLSKKQTADIIRQLILSGHILVYCSCPDFKYRYQYKSFVQGYGIFKELRFPRIRNPQLTGSVCKHMISVLSVLGLHWTSISKDLQNTSYWQKRLDADFHEPADRNAAAKRKAKANNSPNNP